MTGSDGNYPEDLVERLLDNAQNISDIDESHAGRNYELNFEDSERNCFSK